jgi:hypothetical protein
MAGISKTMVAVSAVIAFGLVTLDDMTKGVAEPALQVGTATSDAIVMPDAVLRARAAAALHNLTDKQQAQPVPAGWNKCSEQSWPYYSNDCLADRNGAEPLPNIRVVRVDRQATDQVRPAKPH